MKLPEIGDEFEFDYQYRDERKETVLLIVVDVDETHVMYKMPSVSVNKIFPIHVDEWIKNTDERRPVCKHERGRIYNFRSYPGTREDLPEETGRVECRDCDEVWELGYQPRGMELDVEERA